MLSENFVYLAAAVSLVGESSYIIATLKGRTQPNRVTWFLWAAAPMLAFAGALDNGVGVQALMIFMVGFGPACIFTASFFNPNAFWKVTGLDLTCGALSLCGIATWLATREGNVAIAAAIAADGLAGVPTVVKSYRFPKTEHSWIFWLAALNAIITLSTVDHWDFAHYAFPLYIVTICCSIGALITFRIGEHVSTRSTTSAAPVAMVGKALDP